MFQCCLNEKSLGAFERDLMVRFMLETTRSSYMLNMLVVCHHGMSFEDFLSQVFGSFMLTWQPYVQYNRA